MLCLDNLQELSVALDPFDNKGLTLLMKIPFTKPLKLHIHHTMITTDGIRALKKIRHSKILMISIMKQHRFNYTAIFR